MGSGTGREKDVTWMKEWWLQDMDTWYRQESLVLGIGMAAVLAPPPVTHLLSGTVQDGTWTRTHRCVQDS